MTEAELLEAINHRISSPLQRKKRSHLCMVVWRGLNYTKLIYSEVLQMKYLERITFDPEVMGGKPCIRGMRVTVGMIVGLLAMEHSFEEILRAYPYLEKDDISAALSYAAWRSAEVDVSLVMT